MVAPIVTTCLTAQTSNGRADRLDDAPRKLPRSGRLLGSGLQEGEFVAAEPSDHLRWLGALPQPIRDCGTEARRRLGGRARRSRPSKRSRSTHSTATRLLCETSRSGHRCSRSRKKRAVRQVGERVVPRHMADAGPAACTAVRDVLVSGDIAAVAHREMVDADCPAVLEAELENGVAFVRPLDAIVTDIVRKTHRRVTDSLSMSNNPLKRRPGLKKITR